MKKALPNALTGLRIVLALALLYPAPFSTAFFALYAVCGCTDWLDGFLARKFHVESEFGALLDSVGDAVFLAVTLARVLPILQIPLWVACAVLGIAVIRALSLAVGKKRFHCMTFLHTFLNKAAGLTLFVLLPLFGVLPHAPLYGIGCAVAAIASIEELILLCTMDSLDVNVRGLLFYDKPNCPRKPAG